MDLSFSLGLFYPVRISRYRDRLFHGIVTGYFAVIVTDF